MSTIPICEVLNSEPVASGPRQKVALLSPQLEYSMIVVILAAGRGSRFTESGGEGHKLDALIAGESVLGHVINAVSDAGLEYIVVRPPGGTLGMGFSIAKGVAATPNAQGWLILPGDLPLVSPNTIRSVADALRIDPVVVPTHKDQRGHPVGFQKCCYNDLCSLQGDQGASSIVRNAYRLGRVREFPVNDPGAVFDIDTVSDLNQAQLLIHR